MTLQDLHSVLFKIYLNPGYRLAHQMDPGSFVDHMQLSGEQAELVRNLSPAEAAEFAHGLRSKKALSLNAHMPTTCRWLEERSPHILRDFHDVSMVSRRAQWGATATQLVEYLRECREFYEGVPQALPDLARLEYLLMSARREQERREKKEPASASSPPSFSWNSLYWKAAHTSVESFTVDALSVLLGKKGMTDEGEPTYVVIAPATSGRMPMVLRVTEPAYRILSAMTEPVSARRLHEHAREHGLSVSEEALQALLTRLACTGAVGSYHVGTADVGA
ncbi:hypothetical protein KUM39_09995 [Streptomyces sp. J2-1]|uniref:hypothetical protein n=1 Tax=Streptomyces corallincola TaxID=2851888 RepID=UPI001C38EE76|nr:hypothetical protein [Streptomyces corallincola]MBV2354692.1 hypothetical protein [Streptomyces corallincola]